MQARSVIRMQGLADRPFRFEGMARSIECPALHFDIGRPVAMLRIALAVIVLGLAWTTSAIATSEQNDQSRGGSSTNSQGSTPASAESAGSQYVRSDCDVRRPSCRRWRALAGDRLEKAKDGD